jgi:hypothetical protein
MAHEAHRGEAPAADAETAGAADGVKQVVMDNINSGITLRRLHVCSSREFNGKI